jgi:hypothetical protein
VQATSDPGTLERLGLAVLKERETRSDRTFRTIRKQWDGSARKRKRGPITFSLRYINPGISRSAISISLRLVVGYHRASSVMAVAGRVVVKSSPESGERDVGDLVAGL